jgi:ubiquinone/menaquinone biosynthesis C-methylase UbiE
MDKKTITREFDGKANDYEENRLGEWYIAQLKLLIEHLDDSGQGDVLDIGCGTGWLLRTLAASSPKRRFFGIDISRRMVEAARSNTPSGLDNIEFLAADWESMDLDKLSSYEFDNIFCTSAFHYFAQPGQALAKMHSLLSANGTVYLIERDKSTSLMTRAWDFLHRHYIKDHVRFYSSAEMQLMLSSAGFANIEQLRAVKRYFWHGKLQTNIVYLRGRKAQVG